MKKFVNRPRVNTPIKAASSSGTTFYKIPEKLVKDVFETEPNLIFRYVVHNEGLNAFDLDKLYGSAVFDDTLYLVQTDGHMISIGDEDVYPEDALETFGPEALSAFIKDADKDIVKRELTSYELAPIDLEPIAVDLLESGVSFSDIVDDAEELDLLKRE